MLIDAQDDLGLAGALRSLPGAYDQLAAAALRRSASVRREYSEAGMIDAHLALYRALLGG